MGPVNQPVMTYTLDQSLISNQPNLTVSDSSFFGEYQAFPSIAEIRQQCKLNPGPKQGIVTFPQFKLLVKFGTGVQIAEGQCLGAIRRLFGDHVPVPELYGWRTDNEDVFIFMQLISGMTLEARWDSLTDEECIHVCEQLRGILQDLRSVQQVDSDRFIGQIDGGPLRDIAFPDGVVAGPFVSVTAFNDWFSMLYWRHLEDPTAFQADPYRQSLPDDVPIRFTHGDLHPSNIMVSSTGTPQVISIIDWQQAAWLPEYWEVRKATYTARVGGDWAEHFIPIFLDEWQDTWEAWDFYVAATGN